MARMVTREQAAEAVEGLIAAAGITDQDAIAEAYEVIDRSTVEAHSRDSVQRSLKAYAEQERVAMERVIQRDKIGSDDESGLRHHLLEGINSQTQYLADWVGAWLRDVPAHSSEESAPAQVEEVA